MIQRSNWHVIAVCLLIYLFTAKGYLEISDTSFSLQTAQAITDRGQLDIPYSKNETLQGSGGRYYSKYGIGLPLYFVPGVFVSESLARVTHLPPSELTGFLLSFANIPFALLTLALFALLLKHFDLDGDYSWLLLLGLGLGTLMWHYTVSDFSEEMQMGLLLLAVYGVVRATPKSIVAAGCGFAVLLLVKLVYAAFFPLFLIYLIVRRPERNFRIRSAVLFTIPFVFACCFLAVVNVIRYGNPFESGYGSEAHQFLLSQMPYTIPRLLGSLDKGLFIFCPIFILGLFGWKDFIRKRRPEAIFVASLLLLNLLLAGAWHSWMGGWSWGPRLLVPVIPLWFLPAAFFFQQRKSPTLVWIVAGLTAISIVTQIPGVLVKDQEIHQIKETQLTDQEERFAPSDYVAAWMFLKHKLTTGNEIYSDSELGIPGNHAINLNQYRSFIGLNLWTEHVARQMKKPLVRWFPLAGMLLLIGYIGLLLWSRHAQRLKRPAFSRAPGGASSYP